MNRFVILIAAAMVLITSSCDDAQRPKLTTEQAGQSLSDTLKIPKLEGIKPAVILTSEAALAVENWTFYKALSKAIDSLSGQNMIELGPEIDRIAKVFENKKNAEEAEAPTSPKTVQTKAIQARILAIETQLNSLRNNNNRTVPDIDRAATAIVKLKNGLQNLNLQLNERFAISIKDLLEEIKNEQGDTLSTPRAPRSSSR